MLELIANFAVVGILAVPGLVFMYLVKDAGEDALRQYAEDLRNGKELDE